MIKFQIKVCIYIEQNKKKPTTAIMKSATTQLARSKCHLSPYTRVQHIHRTNALEKSSVCYFKRLLCFHQKGKFRNLPVLIHFPYLYPICDYKFSTSSTNVGGSGSNTINSIYSQNNYRLWSNQICHTPFVHAFVRKKNMHATTVLE